MSARIANLAPSAWKLLREKMALHGGREGEEAKALVANLFRCALAVLHSPQCQADHRDALAHDWAHLPIPRDAKLFDRLVALGDKVALLLDPLADAVSIVKGALGAERTRRLGVIKSKKTAPDLRVTISYFGSAKGRWIERDFEANEEPLSQWGERTGELYLNDDTYLTNVPERVWRHELGGYPVIRKWLGYRGADRRDGAPLTTEEVQYLRSIVQRLGALLALQPELDAAYEAVAADAFTAQELGIRS